MIVVDANIVIYLVCDTPFTNLAGKVRQKEVRWIVPDLWEAEVLNGLMNMMRSGFLDLDDAILAWSNAARALSGQIHVCEPPAILRMAKQSGTTAYDAYYVSLARSMSIPLVTEDRELLRKFPDSAVSMNQFLRGPTPATLREEHSVYGRKQKRGRQGILKRSRS